MSKNKNQKRQNIKIIFAQKEEENAQIPIAKSCEDNIGLDPIYSQSLSCEPVPRPQSYKSASDDGDLGELTSAQKRQRNEVIIKEYTTQNPIKQQKKLFQQPNQNTINFTDDIIYSEEVSELESSQEQNLHPNNQLKLQQDKHHKPLKKRTFFNLLLIGAASTGKTTYKQCFLRQYKQKNQEKVIKLHTTQIEETKSTTMSSNLSLDFYVIDTPGYIHSTVNSYSKLIQQQISRRIVNTKINRKNAMTQSSVYEKQQRLVRDQRIHCCLFFFRGPRLHSDDWRMLKQLHDKCNIIPVIAKGDCYTIEQIAELKKSIITKANQLNIKWFDIQQYIRQKYPQQLPSITKGPYGDSPPFMIACSTTKIQKDQTIKVGRQYKWGTCYIDDEKHTQFNTLNRLLTKYLYTGFVKMIDVVQDVQKAKIQQSNKKNILNKLVIFGATFFVIGMVAKILGKNDSQLKN